MRIASKSNSGIWQGPQKPLIYTESNMLRLTLPLSLHGGLYTTRASRISTMLISKPTLVLNQRLCNPDNSCTSVSLCHRTRNVQTAAPLRHDGPLLWSGWVGANWTAPKRTPGAVCAINALRFAPKLGGASRTTTPSSVTIKADW